MKPVKLFRVVGMLLLMAGMLLGCLPQAEDSSAGIVSHTAAAEDFQSAAAARALKKKKPRLITVENLYAEMLGNSRSLYIYLPPSYYKKPAAEYPVLYVQDGKGVFYASDWSKESLDMHTKADALIGSGNIEELIIVGISNIGEQRSSEFAHWDGFDYAPVKAKGELYEDFIISDVMPFMEEHFRVKTGRENTAIMGASMGGLVSFNIALRNPHLFSKVAVQSPLFAWGNEKLLDKIESSEYARQDGMKIWMDIGSEEGALFLPMRSVIQALLAQGYTPMDELTMLEASGGKHSEASWAQRVEDILLYFYGVPGAPVKLELAAPAKVSILEQSWSMYQHVNPVITYESGMRATDLTGSCVIDDPSKAVLDALGILEAKREGVIHLTHKSATGLEAAAAIEIIA